MKKTIKLLLVTLLAILVSCSQEHGIMFAEQSAFDELATAGRANANSDVDILEDNIIIEKRKMIKEGEVRFETTNSQETRALITKITADTEGYISEDNVYDYTERIEHRMTIRVPADKFDVLLDNISQKASKFDSRNINALDVTEQFVDVEARIKTKKELENRYKELLKQAGKVDEIMAIEKEIGILRTEIESMEGRLRYLKDKVSFSTLRVVFYEKTGSAFGFNSKMKQAMQDGWENLLWLLVILTNIWPFLVIGLVVIFAYRQYRKKKKMRKG